MNDAYTGRVRAGGPPHVREAGSVTIAKRSVGPMDNNAYLVTDTTSGTQVLIDAAADPEVLLAWIDPDRLAWVVTTHRHHDHIGALASVAAAVPEARLAAGSADADAIAEAASVEVTHHLVAGDAIVFGAASMTVITLVGHTPGSVALALDQEGGPTHVFTGDSLFPGGVGKTANPSAFASLLGDVTVKLFDVYDDDTIVYPGHGADTTLGAERPQLGAWRARGW